MRAEEASFVVVAAFCSDLCIAREEYDMRMRQWSSPENMLPVCRIAQHVWIVAIIPHVYSHSKRNKFFGHTCFDLTTFYLIDRTIISDVEKKESKWMGSETLVTSGLQFLN